MSDDDEGGMEWTQRRLSDVAKRCAACVAEMCRTAQADGRIRFCEPCEAIK